MKNWIKDRSTSYFKKIAKKVLNKEKEKRAGKKYKLVEVGKGIWKEVEVTV
jgi:hypothetical protein